MDFIVGMGLSQLFISMKLLISQEELNSKRSRDLIPLECLHCGKTHYRTKNIILRVINGNCNNTLTNCFCSIVCKDLYRQRRQHLKCKECGIDISKIPSDLKKSKYSFCSHKCSAKYNNKSKIILNKCLYCNNEYHPYRGSKRMKYCSSKCHHEHKQYIMFKKIDNGEYKINVPSNNTLKKYLLFKRGHKCEDCGLTTWKNENIPLTVHHIDGNALNNVPVNLQLLCWNCHAMTKNYGSKNKNSARVTRYKSATTEDGAVSDNRNPARSLAMTSSATKLIPH